MKIGFFVNDVATEKPTYTTTRLAMAAARRGHAVWYIGVDDFAYDPDDHVRASARMAPPGDHDEESFIRGLTGPEAVSKRITVDELDVLMLRNNPADEIPDRTWAQSVGLIFGQAARRHGVIVLNDPLGLAKALNKLYFQVFPAEIRPRTLITRSPQEIRSFLKEVGRGVVKPVQGSGGHSVFLVRSDDAANFNQIVETVRGQGYVIVQEYLPDAARGDIRLFLMNGRPLEKDGHYAAIHRVNQGDDLRSNTSAGGDVRRAEIDERCLRIAEIVRPRLVADGMFLVGLDIAGDKVMEINVFSPGGLTGALMFEGIDFAEIVIESVEAKVEHVRRNNHQFDNRLLATL